MDRELATNKVLDHHHYHKTTTRMKREKEKRTSKHRGNKETNTTRTTSCIHTSFEQQKIQTNRIRQTVSHRVDSFSLFIKVSFSISLSLSLDVNTCRNMRYKQCNSPSICWRPPSTTATDKRLMCQQFRLQSYTCIRFLIVIVTAIFSLFINRIPCCHGQAVENQSASNLTLPKFYTFVNRDSYILVKASGSTAEKLTLSKKELIFQFK